MVFEGMAEGAYGGFTNKVGVEKVVFKNSFVLKLR